MLEKLPKILKSGEFFHPSREETAFHGHGVQGVHKSQF